MLWTLLVWHNIFIGKADGTEGLLGVAVNDVVEVTIDFVGHLLDVTILIQVVGAAVFNNLRGTLNVESLTVAVAGLEILNNG